MQVCAVTPLYPPRSLVGSWMATHLLLAGLVEQGHIVDVYRRLSGSIDYELDGVSVHPGRDERTLARAIDEADVVVSHLGDDGMAAYLARRAGKPDVRMVHGSHHDALDRLEHATLAVFNSRSLAAEAGWDGPQIVVHPPVRRSVLATPGNRVTLVNLSQEKGGELFWRLARKRPKQKFLAVKGGWGLQLIFRRPNVEVQPRTLRMSKVFAQTRVLLMPSEHESWGMVGLEAMSCGIPVIAHPTPGLRESLGDAGIFADRDDEAAWLDQLDRLRDPEQWHIDSARARARIEELDPAADLTRFADALTGLVPVGVT